MEKMFLPMLLDLEASYNYFAAGDTMYITARWQNIGALAATKNLRCFLDLEFGYQRIVEGIPKNHRHTIDLFPGFQYLSEGEIMPVTIRYTIPPIWAGTFNLFLGICDEDNNQIEVIGKDGKKTSRISIGPIEVSWGWGKTALDLLKGPWSAFFNNSVPFEDTIKESGTIEIKDTISVKLNDRIPAIKGFKSHDFSFDFESYEPEIVVRDYNNDKMYISYQQEMKLEYADIKIVNNEAIYTGKVFVKDIEAADFVLKFIVNKNILSIEYVSITEKNGFEFIEVRFYSLVAMGGDRANLIDMSYGGRLVPIKTARQTGYTKIYDVRNVGGLYNDDGMAILEGYSLDDKLYVSIDGEKQTKRGVLGSTLAAKVLAHNKVKSIEVPRNKIEIAIFDKAQMEPNWLSFAKYLRRNLKGKNNHIHKQALHSEMYCSQGPQPWDWQVTEDSPWAITRINKGIKFKDMLEEVRKIHNVLDGYKHIPFLYGYHKQNNDDHIPNWYPYEADKRAGTVEDFRKLVEDCKAYNTLMCLYENFDHVYKHGVVDAEFSAMDMFGEPWKGWTWADGVSVEVGFKKYVESGEMQKRVKKMVEIWGHRQTGYIDVLSSEVCRWDYDPQCPSSAQTSLKYRHEVITEYNKYGIDIFSETLTDPWVGVSSYAHGTRINKTEKLYETDKYIPLINAVYHGIIGYNSADCGMSKLQFIKGLEDAGGLHLWVDEPVSHDFVKWVYLHEMPIGLLFDETLEEYVEKDGIKTLIYSGNSSITISEEKKEYEIIYKGNTVGKNWTSFVKSTKNDSWLAYSLNGGDMKYTMPEEFANSKSLRALVLTFDGASDEKVDFRVEGQDIIFNMPIDTPVKVVIE